MTKLREYLPHILALVFALAIVAVVPFLPIKWQDLQGYGYLGVFLINVIGSASIFFPVPGLAVAFVGGGMDLNPLLVALMGAAGSTLGEITGWLAGWGGGVVMEKSKRYAQVEGWMRRYGDITVFVMAAIPNPLFDLAGLPQARCASLYGDSSPSLSSARSSSTPWSPSWVRLRCRVSFSSLSRSGRLSRSEHGEGPAALCRRAPLVC
jgi:membrane protein YqaA with SNARE-associated domain